MADGAFTLPATTLRNAAMATVSDLASGHFAEHMRLNAATRVVVAVRRIGVLQDRGQMQAPSNTWLTRTAQAWDPHAMTAREYVEVLTPDAVDRVVCDGEAWAKGVQPVPTPANEDHELGRAIGA